MSKIMTIELSVVIPTYNCRRFLPKCLDSVFSQLPGHAEVIVVDDGSSDGSVEWLHEKALIHPQLNVVEQSNRGVVNARNRAIALAKGQWIAFLDADDFWYPNKLAPQLDYMRSHGGCVLSFTNYNHVDEEYRSIIDCFDYWSEVGLNRAPDGAFRGLTDPLNTLLATNVVGTSSVMARTDALKYCGLFSAKLNSASDWDMWLKLAYSGHVAFSREVTMGYLMRTGSITSSRLNRLSAMGAIIESVIDYAAPSAIAVKAAKTKLIDGYADYFRGQQNYMKAIQFDVVSLCKAPYWRTFKSLCFDVKKAVRL